MISARTHAALCLGLALFPGCRSEPERSAPAGLAPIAVAIEEISPRPLGTEVEVSGTVRARSSAEVSARIPGVVAAVEVRAGDGVAMGQVLARIDAGELVAGERAAAAGAEAATAAVEAAEQGLAVASAEATLAEATLGRYRQAEASAALTPQEMDEVAARARAATAGHAAAEARLRAARSAREQAAAALEAARNTASYLEIRAPFAGRVGERRIDPGNLVAPGPGLFRIDSAGALRVVCAVDEMHAGRLEAGDPARVRHGLGAKILPAVVVEVEPHVDPASRTFLVTVELEDEMPADLHPGSFARVLLAIGMSERLSLPESAVAVRGQLDFVYVLEEGQARMRLVTLGGGRGARREVLSGLSPGDQLIVAPLAGLSDGRAVTVSP